MGQRGHSKSRGLFFSMERETKIINWNRFFVHHRTVSTLKEIEFLVIRCYIYIDMRGRWCSISVFNVHGPSERKSDGSKDSFYDESEQILNYFSKYHKKILLGDFNAKLGETGYFQIDNLEKELHPDSNDNGIRIANFAHQNNQRAKSTMFPHRKIHKYSGWDDSQPD